MNTTRILRHTNARNCLRLLRDKGPMSRADLARELGATRTTIGYAIKELMDLGLVGSGGPVAQEDAAPDDIVQKGRPGTAVYIEPTGAYFFGTEISTHHLTIVLSDLTLNPVAIERVELTLEGNTPEELLDLLVWELKTLQEKAGVAEIYGLGISLSGIVTPDGRVFLPSLPAWHNINVSGLLRERLPESWDVQCCNDAAALALTLIENLGEAEKEDLLVLMLATNGIGSARVRHGAIDKGAHGIAGEVGLMRLTGNPFDIDSTFQLLAASTGIEGLVDTSNPMETVLREDNNNPAAARTLVRWGDILGAGLLNMIYLLDPSHIVIAGPLAVLFPRVEAQVHALLKRSLMVGLKFPQISVAPPTRKIPAIGAAALVRQQLFLLSQLMSE